METYQNVNGNSGIAGYEIGDTYIEVEFADTERVYIAILTKVPDGRMWRR